MKHALWILFLFFNTIEVLNGQNIGINSSGATPNSSAILDINTGSPGNQGLLIPRMSDNDRQNIKSPATGLIIYDTTISELVVYNGTGWQGISASQVSTGSGAGYASSPGIAINTSGKKPDPSAVLDVASTSEGMLIPRTTTGSVPSPATGLIIYNSATNGLSYYNGSTWISPCTAFLDNHHSTGATAEGVAINATGAVANASAILDISSTNKGLLIPELTSVQRDVVPTPATGLLIYNTDDKGIEYWTGIAWNELSGASGWSLLSPTSPPSQRSNHSEVWDSANGIVLMFGGSNGVTLYNDLWSYKISTNTWTQLHPTGGPPSPREGVTLVWDPVDSIMLLTGGCQIGGAPAWYNDLWAYSPSANTWTLLSPTGSLPSQRYGSSGVWDIADKEMIMYAGAGGPHMDLWSYKPSTNAWTSLSITGGPTYARDAFQSVWDPIDNLMWVFEGNLGGSTYDDLWSYSPSTATWKQYTPTQPPGRAYFVAVWDATSKSVLMFGGLSSGTYYNDLWSYSPATNTWSQINSCGTVPSVRGAFSASWDVNNKTMYIFGGQSSSSSFLNDIWNY